MRKTGTARSRIALLVAALLVIVIGCRSEPAGEEPAAAGSGESELPAASAAGPIDAYLQFATRLQSAGDDAPLEPSQIADGLRHLAGVVGTLDASREQLITDLRAAAEHVLLNPTSPDVAALVRESIGGVAMVLQAAQPSSAASVEAAVQRIRADAPLTSQPAALRGFFRQAAAALPAP